VEGQADLLQVVLALGAGRGVADLLDGRQQKSDEDRDDGDDDQQLDQGEAGSPPADVWTRHETSPGLSAPGP
jgi:hypothetical protein